MGADIKVIAANYIEAGWAVVPIVKGEKRAESSWTSRDYLPKHFKTDDSIAAKCGEPSGWKVDVDCDASEAVQAAKMLLPNTGMVHGRPGKPDSHYWYLCEGIATKQFTDVKDSSGKAGMLVELRSSGGYTLIPPSIHPSGDVMVWSIQRDFMRLTPEALYDAGCDVAIAALLGRHWPAPGVRHAFAGHLAGFLCNAGLDSARITSLFKAAMAIAGDTDLHDRLQFVNNTIGKFRAGENVTGGPKLADEVGQDVINKMRGWLKLVDSDAIEEMNVKHFWVRMGKDDVIGREDAAQGVIFQRVKSLYSEYANRKIITGEGKDGQPKLTPLFQAWLESPLRRSYREVVFAPPPRIAEPHDYNLWSGFAIQPDHTKPCDIFLTHLREIICSGDLTHYEYLMNLLALTVQEPGTPSEVATVLRGEPGAGKGMFVRALGKIFGKHFAHLDKVNDLVGGFNAAISGKVIVFADEAFWAGDKREIGALKRLITEPTLRITRKGIDSTEEANHIHLFMATNEEWAVPAQFRERRFFALHVSSDKLGDQRYFSMLEDEIAHGGLSGLLALLLTRPVNREMIRKVPKTRELRTQQAQSMPSELEWWQDCLYEGRIGNIVIQDTPAWVPIVGLYDAYSLWIAQRKTRMLSKIEFGRRMVEYISSTESKSRRINGENVRALEVRALEEARKYFDGKLASGTDWPTDGPAQPPLPNPF